MYEKVFFRDMSIATGSLTAFAGLIAMVALILWNREVLYGSGNALVYLHYKIFMGVDYYARWQYIFLLPFSGVVCMGVNYVFSRILVYSHRTLAQMLMICAALFQYLLLFAIYLLIQINIF